VGQPKYDLSLSVFFPCYNEEDNVEPLARKTVAVLEPLGPTDLVIVDPPPGLHDGTAIQ